MRTYTLNYAFSSNKEKSGKEALTGEWKMSLHFPRNLISLLGAGDSMPNEHQHQFTSCSEAGGGLPGLQAIGNISYVPRKTFFAAGSVNNFSET